MYFVWTSTRGGGGPAHGDRWEGGQKREFFVDVINGWPLSTLSLESNDIKELPEQTLLDREFQSLEPVSEKTS